MQEALTNVLKHSAATGREVRRRVDTAESVVLEVTDGGPGARADARASPGTG